MSDTADAAATRRGWTRSATLAQPLGEAFDRLEDFLAVWSDGITPDAVERLQESVGIDADVRHQFATRLAHVQPSVPAAGVLLGLPLGLSSAQLRASAAD